MSLRAVSREPLLLAPLFLRLQTRICILYPNVGSVKAGVLKFYLLLELPPRRRLAQGSPQTRAEGTTRLAPLYRKPQEDGLCLAQAASSAPAQCLAPSRRTSIFCIST